MTLIYEACVTTVSQAQAAARAGANRLELCARLGTGGLTPPASRLAAVCEAVPIPVHAMIRRGADGFHPDTRQRRQMRADVGAARLAGASGIVTGVLDRDGGMDLREMSALLELADGLPVTFHRAFDLLPDPFEALESLASIGVRRILTSGGAPTARQGTTRLRDLVAAARGRIELVAAGMVRADHVATLIADTGVRAVHAHLKTGRAMRELAEAIAVSSKQ